MMNIFLAIPSIYLGADYWDPLTSEYLFQVAIVLTPSYDTKALKKYHPSVTVHYMYICHS